MVNLGKWEMIAEPSPTPARNTADVVVSQEAWDVIVKQANALQAMADAIEMIKNSMGNRPGN